MLVLSAQGGADERGELQVLVAELDEFDASPAPLQVLSEPCQLHGLQCLMTPLPPRAVERLEPRRAVRPGGHQGGEIRVC